jgi:16S rRNA (cytosine967-C5)-methyltransferase
MSTQARALAAAAIERITESEGFSQRVLAGALSDDALPVRDRAWVTRAVYGTLTHLERIDTVLDRLVDRGARSLPTGLQAHLRIAVWEIALSETRSDPAPLVSAAVEAIKRDGHPRSAGLANAVLRRMLREREIVLRPPKRYDATSRMGWELGLPGWMAEALVARLGGLEPAEEAARGFVEPAPVGFRVRNGDRDAVIAELAEAGLEVEPHPFAPDGGLCSRGNLAATAAHTDRRIVIQDPGAQLAIAALPPAESPRILDVASGIGGKTLALRDRYPNADVLAIDAHAGKLAHLSARPELAGVRTAKWSVGQEPPPASLSAEAAFDIVVVDAPCTALGTIGRHPEVRWNREPEDIDAMCATQRAMLEAVTPFVARGGTLLYVVCTWTPEESSSVVDAFLASHPDFVRSVPGAQSADPRVAWDGLVDERGVVSLWPHTTRTDGFTFARFQRER